MNLAGADIKEMANTQFSTNYKTDFLGHWSQVSTIRKPIIAAVNGFAVRRYSESYSLNFVSLVVAVNWQ
jgi:hypothetical protein